MVFWRVLMGIGIGGGKKFPEMPALVNKADHW